MLPHDVQDDLHGIGRGQNRQLVQVLAKEWPGRDQHFGCGGYKFGVEGRGEDREDALGRSDDPHTETVANILKIKAGPPGSESGVGIVGSAGEPV